MGVPKMYKEFLSSCKDEILDALRIFSERQNYPILVHCTQGKDRTGLMCMLLLGIAGAPDSNIVNDYAKTQEGLAPVLSAMIQEMAKSGLSEVFATAPPEVKCRQEVFLSYRSNTQLTFFAHISSWPKSWNL
jgi:hypothetical protein